MNSVIKMLLKMILLSILFTCAVGGADYIHKSHTLYTNQRAPYTHMLYGILSETIQYANWTINNSTFMVQDENGTLSTYNTSYYYKCGLALRRLCYNPLLKAFLPDITIYITLRNNTRCIYTQHIYFTTYGTPIVNFIDKDGWGTIVIPTPYTTVEWTLNYNRLAKSTVNATLFHYTPGDKDHVIEHTNGYVRLDLQYYKKDSYVAYITRPNRTACIQRYTFINAKVAWHYVYIILLVSGIFIFFIGVVSIFIYNIYPMCMSNPYDLYTSSEENQEDTQL